jgi:hypothetical protein
MIFISITVLFFSIRAKTWWTQGAKDPSLDLQQQVVPWGHRLLLAMYLLQR